MHPRVRSCVPWPVSGRGVDCAMRLGRDGVAPLAAHGADHAEPAEESEARDGGARQGDSRHADVVEGDAAGDRVDDVPAVPVTAHVGDQVAGVAGLGPENVAAGITQVHVDGEQSAVVVEDLLELVPPGTRDRVVVDALEVFPGREVRVVRRADEQQARARVARDVEDEVSQESSETVAGRDVPLEALPESPRGVEVDRRRGDEPAVPVGVVRAEPRERPGVLAAREDGEPRAVEGRDAVRSAGDVGDASVPAVGAVEPPVGGSVFEGVHRSGLGRDGRCHDDERGDEPREERPESESHVCLLLGPLCSEPITVSIHDALRIVEVLLYTIFQFLQGMRLIVALCVFRSHFAKSRKCHKVSLYSLYIL